MGVQGFVTCSQFFQISISKDEMCSDITMMSWKSIHHQSSSRSNLRRFRAHLRFQLVKFKTFKDSLKTMAFSWSKKALMMFENSIVYSHHRQKSIHHQFSILFLPKWSGYSAAGHCYFYPHRHQEKTTNDDAIHIQHSEHTTHNKETHFQSAKHNKTTSSITKHHPHSKHPS